MHAFFQWTAWEMEKPTAYGGFHILFTLVLLAIAVSAAWGLRNVEDRGNRIVLGAVGGFLLLAEVYKILFHITVDPYDWQFWGTFPFQLCSVPMYLSLFCAFCRNEKINKPLYEFMFAVNMFGGIMAFIEPSGINHSFITLTVHAYIWHMALIFLGLYLYFSRRACVDARSYRQAVAVYLGACLVAQSFNLIFAGKVNCFYISPYIRSPLAVFKNIYTSCGWVVNMVLLILGLIIASGAVYYLGYYLRKRTRKTENNNCNFKSGMLQ